MIITLTTDFGLADPYVAMMKGVIYGIAPDVTIVDITHQVDPQDIRGGGVMLAEGIDYFPPGAIHVAVVDPGVGSNRRPLVARIGDFYFVGPDNGLMSPLVATGRSVIVREIADPTLPLASVSTTFHGRDIFAPTAAKLATGFPFEQIGPLVDDPILLPPDEPQVTPKGLEGRIVRADRFGNLITNISQRMVDQARREGGSVRLSLGDQEIPFVSTYADVAPGAPGAVVGSAGMVELFVRNGDANEVLRKGGSGASTYAEWKAVKIDRRHDDNSDSARFEG